MRIGLFLRLMGLYVSSLQRPLTYISFQEDAPGGADIAPPSLKDGWGQAAA
jgi:hypothetical protein